MGFTFIASVSGYRSSSGVTSVTASSTLNVQAGDVLVGIGEWQFAGTGDTTTIVQSDDSTNLMTLGREDVQSSDIGGAIHYKLNATADSTAEFKLEVSASSRRLSIIVLQFRPDGSETQSTDGTPSVSKGSSTALNSGNITTSGSDTVIVGGGSSADLTAFTSVQIGADAADAVITESYLEAWYKLYDSGQTNVAANATVADDNWVGTVLGIKSVAAGGTLTISVADCATAKTILV